MISTARPDAHPSLTRTTPPAQRPAPNAPGGARILVMWTGYTSVQVFVDGRADHDALERLERVLDLLVVARASHVCVDLTRLDGPDTPVLELLAALCHRLWRRRGRLHIIGLQRRLCSSPEVAAFPEVFGDLTGLTDHPDHQPAPRPT